MLSSVARPLAVASLVLVVFGCDKKPMVAPAGDDALTHANALLGLSSASNVATTAVSPSEIGLSWQDNATNETGFEISRSTAGPGGPFALQATTSANAVSYHDAGLASGTQYCYKVRAFRRLGRKTSYAAFSATACATTPIPPPSAPSNVSARPTSSSSVAIVWTDNSTNETGFRVERSTIGGEPWAAVAAVGANVTSAVDAQRPSEQLACYRVFASGPSGESAPSTVDCTTPPAGPTDLTAAAVPQGVDLMWEDNSSVEEMYEVLRSVDGVTFTSAAWLPASKTTYRDVTAIGNNTYWYQIRAVKDGGFSDLSNTASATSTCVPTGSVETVCNNGTDDDCDGLNDPLDSDCAGPDCGFFFCPPSYVCGYDGVCVPHCGDGAQNGTEGDVDCGGDCSTKCQAGQQCGLHYDCASGNCYFGICQNSGATP